MTDTDTHDTHTGMILLVDDDSFIADMFSAQLSARGFVVHEALSADAALSLLRGGLIPDIIIFDITMPQLNGLQFLDALRAGNLAPKAIRIALTNDGKEGEEEEVYKRGAHAFLIKAATQTPELAATIDRLRTAGASAHAPVL
jgi:CheY-like chemotaxis protein